ncbi:RNA-directed DNA polymerase, eukaryota, partial [Tanacetum coccineum]
LGDGELEEENDGEVEIDVPEENLIDQADDPIAAIVDFTYPNILNNIHDLSYFKEKAVLAPTNEVVDNIHEHLLDKFPGEEMVYLSCDSVDKTERNDAIDKSIFSPEFINGLKFSDVPNHRLALKVGVPVMLLKNIDQPNVIDEWAFAARLINGLVVPLFVTMPAQRSNEDQAVRISKSIFVTNFPDNLGSKELWKVCEGYGKVIDVFIPNRRSKAGKRFAFVRFIRVNDLDRLVGNLCTIWIGRFHLHANVARFERANKPVKPSGPSQSNAHGTFGSFVSAARDFPPLIASVAPVSSSPALVLDDSCVVERDLSCHVMGRVKDINSIPNLRILLAKEGFEHVKLSYLGG